MTTNMTTKTNIPQGVVLEAIKKETKDLYLAAAFHAEGIKLVDVDKTDRTRMIFIFEGGEHADEIEKQWWQGNAIGSYSVYASSIRAMKSLIHS